MYRTVSVIQSPPRKYPRDRLDVPNRYQKKNPTRTKKQCQATCPSHATLSQILLKARVNLY